MQQKEETGVKREINVMLGDTDKELINKHVIKPKNIVKACKYAGIHFGTFKGAMAGNLAVTAAQRKKLIRFCEKVKSLAK